MVTVNYYPVSYSDFMKIKNVGHYIVMYCVLEDRVHFEMPVENSIYVTQRFMEDIETELKLKAENMIGDKITTFLKMTLNDVTSYKYFPTDKMVEEIKEIQLFTKLNVTTVNPGVYADEDLKIIQNDTSIKALNGNELVLEAEKVL